MRAIAPPPRLPPPHRLDHFPSPPRPADCCPSSPRPADSDVELDSDPVSDLSPSESNSDSDSDSEHDTKPVRRWPSFSPSVWVVPPRRTRPRRSAHVHDAPYVPPPPPLYPPPPVGQHHPPPRDHPYPPYLHPTQAGAPLPPRAASHAHLTAPDDIHHVDDKHDAHPHATQKHEVYEIIDDSDGEDTPMDPACAVHPAAAPCARPPQHLPRWHPYVVHQPYYARPPLPPPPRLASQRATPPPPPPSSKSPRSRSRAASSAQSRTASPAPARSPTPCTSPPPRRHHKARNMQVHISTDEFQTMLKAALETLRCPLDGCDYVQEPPLRSQDMRRHLESHRSNKNRQKWVCCGVPREHMAVYGVTVPYNTITFKGIEMVNGCLRTFSRRDALVRHIKTQNNQCLAEEGFWHLLHAPEPPDSSAGAM